MAPKAEIEREAAWEQEAFARKLLIRGNERKSKQYAALGDIVRDLAPRNAELLARRNALQTQIDDFYRERGPAGADPAEQERFLRKIGYIVPDAPEHARST